jgi:hypothetical protein
MEPLRFFFLGFILLATVRAEPPRKNVVDYFLLLPEKDFEAPPAAWLKGMQLNHDGTIDIANGYISCPGDGGQPDFEVALFRFRDGHPLIAVGSAELEGDQKRGVYLKFYELGADGKMHVSRRPFLPIKDVDNARGKWSFDLPQHGRTIVVHSYASGKVMYRFTWNGEKFSEN